MKLAIWSLFLLSPIVLSPIARADSLLASPPQKVAEGFQFTEGPVWVPKTQSWIFSDIPANTLYEWKSGQARVFLNPSGNTNGNVLNAAGQLVSCQHEGRVTRYGASGPDTLARYFEGKPFNSPNDLAIGRDGSIYFTDPTYGLGKRPSALGFRGLYRLFPNRKVALLDAEWQQPNGICFSPDFKTLYVNDSQTGKLFSFDVLENGNLQNKTLLVTIPGPGVPDGMKCDAKGRIWVGAGGGAQVFSPKGELLEKVSLPKDAANLAFGGADGKTLFLTARDVVYTARLK